MEFHRPLRLTAGSPVILCKTQRNNRRVDNARGVLKKFFVFPAIICALSAKHEKHPLKHGNPVFPWRRKRWNALTAAGRRDTISNYWLKGSFLFPGRFGL
jgi:hypothetical protein